MNLIQKTRDIKSYFCTWNAQSNYNLLYPSQEKDGTILMRDMMREETVFSENGMIHLLPEIRSHLYFVFDDGWDVPYHLAGSTPGAFGSLKLNELRFPSFTGSPAERLKKLNDKVKSYGWKGTGLWICAGGETEKPGHYFSQAERESYWKERLEWSKYAGIAYWKVDWGEHCMSLEFRKQLIDWKNEIYPELLIEHAGVADPFNDWRGGEFSEDQSGRFCDWKEYPEYWASLLKFSDVLRTYDVSDVLSVPTTLDRVQFLLRVGPLLGSNTMINAENENYLCAALGLETGIMSHELKNPDNGNYVWPDHLEAVRAVRFMTAFAPAFPAGEGTTRFGRYTLTDSYNFGNSRGWLSTFGKKDICQSAPALICRNCYQPEVTYEEEQKPYIVVSRNPNGAFAIASLRRSDKQGGHFIPKASVRMNLEMHNPTLGVFGEFEKVTVVTDASIGGKKIFAQDLAADEAVDISECVERSENEFTLRGEMIHRIGTSRNTDKDTAGPGLVVQIL